MIAIQTAFAANGEIDVFLSGDHLVISACEERTIGHNRVHARKATLQLTRRDAADLKRAIDCVLRDAPRAGQWNDTALHAMAEEGVA